MDSQDRAQQELKAGARWIANAESRGFSLLKSLDASSSHTIVGDFFHLLYDAIPKGNEVAISLSVDYLIDDPLVSFGRISKTKIARRLKHHVALISESRRWKLTERLLYLLEHEITPTETLHICRIVRQFLSPQFLPRILSLPIWNKYVDQRCNLLLPNFDEHCLESEPTALRKKSKHELRENWTSTDAVHVGRIIFESVPIGHQGQWADQLMDFVESRVCKIPVIRDGVWDFTEGTLSEADILTRMIDCKWLSWLLAEPPALDMTFGLREIYHLNTFHHQKIPIPSKTAIIAYRTYACLSEIRHRHHLNGRQTLVHRGWSVSPLLKAVVDQVGDHHIETDAWRLLTRYL